VGNEPANATAASGSTAAVAAADFVAELNAEAVASKAGSKQDVAAERVAAVPGQDGSTSQAEAPLGGIANIASEAVAAAQRSVAESVQQQIDSASKRVQKLPQDAVDGIVGFAKDRVDEAVEDVKAVPGRLGEQAKKSVEAAAQDAARGIAGIPGQLVSATVSATQRRAEEFGQGLQEATQRRVAKVGEDIQGTMRSKMDQVVRQTLDVPQSFVTTLAMVPGRVGQVLMDSVQRKVDEVGQSAAQVPRRAQEAAVSAAQGAQASVVAGVTARQQATVEAIRRAPSAAAGWLQAGVERKVQDAAKDTRRLAEDIGSSPAVIGSAAKRAVDKAGQAAGDAVTGAVTGAVDQVTVIPKRTQQELTDLLDRIKPPFVK